MRGITRGDARETQERGGGSMAIELLPFVGAGVKFKDGVRVERDDGQVVVLAKKRRQ